MKAVVELRDKRQAAVRDHPFFAWLRAGNVPLERRLDFALAMALFAMQFRDMCRVNGYAEPSNEWEWVITRGTMEDCTHSRLFIEDWRALGLDERLGWGSSDTLWWLFGSAEQEPMRRAGMRFLSHAVADGANPLIRYGHLEAGEATGHVMLDHTAPIADALAQQTGRDHPYFGSYHLALETGHVANTEGVFETLILDEATRAAALRACGTMFDLFDGIFTCWDDYARRYVDTGRFPVRPAAAAARRGVPPAPIDLTALYDDPHNAQVARVLERRHAQAAAHPFYEWLEADDGVSPGDRLCRFVPLWTMDCLGYADLTRYALSYPDPQSDAEQAINDWARELSTHSKLFLADWDSLGLDGKLGLTASGTLELIFLDADLDQHRQHLIEFAQLAMRYQDPALRWWMLTALEATGETFFAHTRPLAEAAGRETGTRLDYLAERHCAGLAASQARPARPPKPLRPQDVDVAIHLVDTVFDAMETNLGGSDAAARADRFGIAVRT